MLLAPSGKNNFWVEILHTHKLLKYLYSVIVAKYVEAFTW